MTGLKSEITRKQGRPTFTSQKTELLALGAKKSLKEEEEKATEEKDDQQQQQQSSKENETKESNEEISL